jgi:2-polyprenyl-3-methyl-5-hydroxy-6-metoxy-1,4-benzoquinol methylase
VNHKIAGGVTEDGIVVGNTFDKYGARNPVVRWMMAGFTGALDELVAQAAPTSIHEIGCGEGYWVVRMHTQGKVVRGSDFSAHVIALARENAQQQGIPADLFEARSIYALRPGDDSADLLVCCEVLEHLDDPVRALEILQKVVTRHLIVSVPNEPLWRALNFARGKYVGSMGNTPGHLQHWSRRRFIALISRYFTVTAVRSPLPWTMLLCRPLP